MTLNCLRSYRSKYSKQFGELVIVCDSRKYWRREIFPYYKHGRKKSRDESGLNWELIFGSMNKIQEELIQFFPYKFIKVDRAEADDVISVLTNKYSRYEPVLIMSSDTDFVQLHTNNNVKQYDPVRKKWIKTDDPYKYIKEHIIEGDKTDGVPNVCSPDDTFVVNARQKTIRKAKKEQWLDTPERLLAANLIDNELYRNFCRNRDLIDLSRIPEDLKLNIIEEYDNQDNNPKGRQHIFNYFIKYQLKNLMKSIQDF